MRILLVTALSTLVVAYTLPDLRRLWHPPGTMGFAADLNNVVIGASYNPAAVKAGLRDGDRIDLWRTKPEFRIVAADAGTTAEPGTPVTFATVRGAQERVMSVPSEPMTMSGTEKALLLGRLLAMLLFVGIGTALVLLRPCVATWGFYFYCLGLNGAPSVVSSTLLGSPWNWIDLILSQVLMPTVAFVGVFVFALSFLHEPMRGWRRLAYRLSPILFVALFGLEAYTFAAQSWFGWRAELAGNAMLLLQGAIALIAMCALVATYVTVRGNDRQRIRWVVLAFAIALVAAVVSVSPMLLLSAPYWLYASVALIGVVVPIAVAYAVIKHRVIDVSLVVSRALVYTVLTTVLVGVLSIIDWFFIEKLKLVRLGTIAEVCAAVGIGFWFNGLHHRVDAFIDAVFFRQRHRAEVRLARAATALPLAPTMGGIAHFLIDEPTDALALASAALFRRRSDGRFVREESRGWEVVQLPALADPDVPLLMLVQTAATPLSLYDYRWRSNGLPTGPARPVLALPIMVRRELVAVVLYGTHVHGEPLDPDEVRALGQLAPAAAIAFDHLEGETLRREIDVMRREVEKLRGVVAELQIQPT